MLGMLGRSAAVFAGVSLVCGSAAAQVAPVGVAAEPQSEVAGVAPGAQVAEPEGVRVGDTIMMPALPEQDDERNGEPATKRRWYGAPILIVDGAAYVCILIAASDRKLTPVAAPGVAGYLLGGPITHLAHGNWGRAGFSVLARGALPLVAAAAAKCEANSGDCVSDALSLAVIGMLAATALDTAVLSTESEPVQSVGLKAEPVMSVGANHALFFGAAGTF